MRAEVERGVKRSGLYPDTLKRQGKTEKKGGGRRRVEEHIDQSEWRPDAL